MTNAARSRGVVLAALLALPVTALAQFEPTLRESLHGCAVLESVSRRLECIDGVLARVDEARGETGASTRTGTERPQAEDDDTGAPRADASRPPTSPSNPGAGSQGEAGNASRAADSSADAADGDRTVVVVEVDTRLPGRAVFVTEEGDRFVQTSGGSRLFLPSVPFEAEISEGAVGSQFLSPVEQGRAVRVTRRD